MDTNLSTTDSAEALARASLQPGFVPPVAETKTETTTQATGEDTQETPTGESVTEQTPAEKQQANNSDPEPEKTEEPEKSEAEEPKSKDDKRKEREQSAFQKVANRHKELTNWEKELTARRDSLDKVEAEKLAVVTQREQRIQQVVAQLESFMQDDGKLPDYQAADGKTYPAEMLMKFVGDSFAAGEEEQGRKGMTDLIRLAMQKGNAMGLKPTKDQWQNAERKLSLIRGERPELRADSGTEHDRVMKQFLASGPFVDLLAREPDGIDALVKFTDMAVAGFEVPKLKAEIAELKKLNGEKSKEVAHYEKTTAPQRAGIARKPAAQKPIGELPSADLELKARRIFADAGFQ